MSRHDIRQAARPSIPGGFRISGALYERMLRARLDPRLVIAILAAGWAVLHYSYAGGVIALIFVGGLLLGAARRQTGSVVPPILMHMLWNLWAIW